MEQLISEENYSIIWGLLFILWLFFMGFSLFIADDLETAAKKLVEKNNAKLNQYGKENIKQSILDHNDSYCNCGNSWTYCMFHSEY